MVTNEDVIRFVEENSWFITEDVSELSFSSNKYGDHFNGEYGEKDYDEAIRICKMIKKEFRNIEYDIDTFDEWVYVYISITEGED